MRSTSKARAKSVDRFEQRELSPHCVDISETAGAADTPVSLVRKRNRERVGRVERHDGIQFLRAASERDCLVNFGSERRAKNFPRYLTWTACGV